MVKLWKGNYVKSEFFKNWNSFNSIKNMNSKTLDTLSFLLGCEICFEYFNCINFNWGMIYFNWNWNLYPMKKVKGASEKTINLLIGFEIYF